VAGSEQGDVIMLKTFNCTADKLQLAVMDEKASDLAASASGKQA